MTLLELLESVAGRLAAAERALESAVDDPARRAQLARKVVTERDPLAFALIYLPRHLVSDETGGRLTLSEIHYEWAKIGESWIDQPAEPYANRRAEIGPRAVGKSTWLFLLLPMWAAAHGHRTFVAAFANTPTQAETHLASFKSELDNNELLRADFPELVAPKTRGRGTTEADRVSLYHAESGFVFAAAGMDSSNLGLKVGAKRPDLIICDDLEPHEGNYSALQAEKRLGTLIDAILPLNIFAAVVLVGTVTMVDSIMHQLAKASQGIETADWITEQRIVPHLYPAIIVNEDGSRRSIWPEKWSLEFLKSIEHTREYAKNYANDPLAADGPYWSFESFVREELEGITRRGLSIDPAVTTKDSSDFTGLGVVGWSPSLDMCLVEYAAQVKLPLEVLRQRVIALVEELHCGFVLVETNQGGDVWKTILHDLPVPLYTVHQVEKKEVRAAAVLAKYDRKRVRHSPRADLRQLEAQMVAFPRAPHDDMVDAVGSLVARFLIRRKKRRASIASDVIV